jgi:hypothetical protein
MEKEKYDNYRSSLPGFLKVASAVPQKAKKKNHGLAPARIFAA